MDILQHQQIVSDKLEGVIRNPFAFYFPIQWGFSESIQAPPCVYASKQRASLQNKPDAREVNNQSCNQETDFQ